MEIDPFHIELFFKTISGLESACTDLMQEATGQELPTPSHNTQKSSKIIECRPCGRVFFDRASVQVHLNSKKHVENVKKAAAGCLNGQKNADQKRIAGRGMCKCHSLTQRLIYSYILSVLD